jgi:arylsulfatase
VDRSIDVVLDALEATGQADGTIVIFTADHGEMAGSHGLRQKANFVYDENFHVPLIISHPDFADGAATEAIASAVDLVPTILDFAGAEPSGNLPDLPGHSLVPAMAGGAVRDGVLTAVESVIGLDADFWAAFSDPEAQQGLASGELRPDVRKRGFLRGYTDDRYTFGRYFSPIEPNRPTDTSSLFAHNDVVLYDRDADPYEQTNLAAEPEHHDLIAQYSTKLERLISDEIGEDTNTWVYDRPNLIGWPSWRGDASGGQTHRVTA